MKLYNILVFILLTISTFSQSKIKQKIDSIFSEWNKTETPGGAVGIFKDGEILFSKGYGLANLEYNIPNSPTSVFRIASTSKQFTAACIVKLAEKGKVSLDDNLKSFFPEFPDYAEKITIRHLLNHTSGIRDYYVIAYLKGLTNNAFFTDEDVMDWLINQQELNFEPGSQFMYSNSGYWLIYQIINKVSSMNMADFAQSELFKPLKMNFTHFQNNHNQIVKNRASGYSPKKDNEYQINMTSLDMIGDGGIFTTIEDLKNWDDEFYSHNTLGDNFWKTMTQKAILNNGDTIDYACGLFIEEYNGYKTIRHRGSFVGFKAEYIRFPEEGFSIAILANRSDANPARLVENVADLFLADNSEIKSSPASQKSININPSELKQFTGKYWSKKQLKQTEIKLINDTLFYHQSNDKIQPLIPISKNQFKLNDINSETFLTFEKNSNQKLIRISIQNIEDDELTYFNFKPKSIEELKQIEGSYYSKEMEVNYHIKLHKNQLELYINNQYISPLLQVYETTFKNDRFGVFIFEEHGFRLNTSRAKNILFIKQ